MKPIAITALIAAGCARPQASVLPFGDLGRDPLYVYAVEHDGEPRCNEARDPDHLVLRCSFPHGAVFTRRESRPPAELFSVELLIPGLAAGTAEGLARKAAAFHAKDAGIDFSRPEQRTFGDGRGETTWWSQECNCRAAVLQSNGRITGVAVSVNL